MTRLDKLPALAHELGAQSLLLMPVDDPSGKLLLNKRRLLDYNRRIAPALAERSVALGLMRDPGEAYPFGATKDELAASRKGHYARGLYERQPCYAPWTHALDHRRCARSAVLFRAARHAGRSAIPVLCRHLAG